MIREKDYLVILSKQMNSLLEYTVSKIDTMIRSEGDFAAVQKMHQNKLKYGKWLQKIVWNKEKRNPIMMLYTDNFMLGKCNI